MAADDDVFKRSVREQIMLNQARTPTERFLALCDLLDAVRAMAPKGPEARERRLRAMALREREREQLRDFCRRCLAAGGSDVSTSV